MAEGSHIIMPIVKMIDAAVAAKSAVGATRDFHPHDHCSFLSRGGPFPPHCVQGTAGAKFVSPIAEALAAGALSRRRRRGGARDHPDTARRPVARHVDRRAGRSGRAGDAG